MGEHEELPETEVNEGSMTADPEIETLLENGNMEQLAGLVLNGEGRRLVGRHSGNPELQAFIDRVPSYMVLRTTCVAKHFFCLFDLFLEEASFSVLVPHHLHTLFSRWRCLFIS